MPKPPFAMASPKPKVTKATKTAHALLNEIYAPIKNLMQQYIDAHCHLGIPQSGDGIAGFVCNTTDESQWAKTLAIANQDRRVLPCIGVHPWYVSGVTPGWDARMYELVRQNPRAMVGEIGLDKLHDNFDAQREIFLRQLEIASELKRVVHIHCVRAWDEMLRGLAGPGAMSVPAIVFHGFTGTPEIITGILRHANAYFSYSPTVLDARRKRLGATIAATPTNKILVESDAPIGTNLGALAPICARIADVKNIKLETAADIIYNNTIRAMVNG